MAGTHLESNLGHLAYGHIRRLRVGGCSSVAEHWLHKPGVLGVDFQWLPNIFKLRFRILLSMFFFFAFWIPNPSESEVQNRSRVRTSVRGGGAG